MLRFRHANTFGLLSAQVVNNTSLRKNREEYNLFNEWYSEREREKERNDPLHIYSCLYNPTHFYFEFAGSLGKKEHF